MPVINQIQETILTQFSKVTESPSFYLTGGTALAYFYLKHRESNDLDFFTTDEDLLLPFSFRLEELLKEQKMEVERRRGLRSFVELIVKNKTEETMIHLALDAAFRFEPTQEFSEFPGLKVDSLKDIAVNKLLALFGRAAFRDFVDVYFLVHQADFETEFLIKNAKIKDPGFDLYWLGVAFERINTFQDASLEMLLLLKPLRFKEIADFFNGWRQKIVQQLSS